MKFGQRKLDPFKNGRQSPDKRAAAVGKNEAIRDRNEED